MQFLTSLAFQTIDPWEGWGEQLAYLLAFLLTSLGESL